MAKIRGTGRAVLVADYLALTLSTLVAAAPPSSAAVRHTSAVRPAAFPVCLPREWSATGVQPGTPASAGHYVAALAALAASTQTPCAPGSCQPPSGQTGCPCASPGNVVSVPAATTRTACTAGLQLSGLGISSQGFSTTVKWTEVSLPEGMTLLPTGVFPGVPGRKPVPGAYSVTVKATGTVTTLSGSTRTRTKTTAQATIPLTIG